MPIPSALSAVSFLFASALASAAPKAPADVVAPFIDDGTFVIVRADPERLDVAAVEKLALQFAGKLAGDAGGLAAEAPVLAVKGAAVQAKAWLAEYKRAGGGEAYWLMSVNDIPEYPGLLL